MSTATLIARILAIAAVAAFTTVATNPADSAGGVSVAGPVCLAQTAQPGNSNTVQANLVNATGSTAQLDHATDPNLGPPAGPPYPAGRHPIPRAWVTLSGPYTIGGQSTVPAPVTVNVPPGTPPGRYGTTLEAHSFGTPRSSGDQAAFGGGAGTWLEISVQMSPPPRAFCTGQRQTYWPWRPPMLGRQPWCRVLPLSPPVFSAKACGWTRHQMLAYFGQLRAAGRRDAHNPSAYLADAHRVVHGHILNRQAFYRSTGWYRFADDVSGSAAAAAVVTSRYQLGPIAWALLTGMVVHVAGDSLTKDGTTPFTPISAAKVRLPPYRLRIKTGHKVERRLHRPVFAATLLAALGFAAWRDAGAVAPALRDHVARWGIMTGRAAGAQPW